MRATVVGLVAALLGIAAAWGATRLEFSRFEKPVPTQASALPGVPGQPLLKVDDREIIDFGLMEVHETQQHAFLIQNWGDAPLTLTRGKTSCRCVLSELKQGAVLPGETATVLLSWTPTEATENFEQTALIATNDPDRNPLTLTIRGRVRDSIKIDPVNIPLGQFAAADVFRYDVKVWSYRKKPWQMESATFDEAETAKFFQVVARDMTAEEVADLPDAENGQVLSLTIQPGIPLGIVRQTIRVLHNFDERGPFDIYATGKAVGDITVLGRDYSSEQELVQLGNIGSDQGKKSELSLLVKGAHRENVKIKIKSIDPESSLRATLGEPTPLGNSVRWPLTVEIPPGAEPVNRLGSERGRLARIELETTHPDLPSYTLKLRFAVSPE